MNKSVNIDEEPKYQIPIQQKPPRKQAKGSLFQGKRNSLFSDRKELQIGDIVYITVNEGPDTVETKSERTTSLNDEGTSQTGGSLNNVPSTSMPVVGGLLDKSLDALNKVLGIGFTLPSRSGTFSATSEAVIEDILEYDISAVVAEQYVNGNCLLEGLKQVVINGQKHTLRISGVLNPQELKGTTISSDKLANLKVIYFKDGDEQDYMEKPWGTKILETISPF
jgi:flagellar L-ring protein precursor FlgH